MNQIGKKRRATKNKKNAVKLFMHMQSLRPLLREKQKRCPRRTKPEKDTRGGGVVLPFVSLSMLCARNHNENSGFKTLPEEHPKTPNSAQFQDFGNVLATFGGPTQGFKPLVILFSKGLTRGSSMHPKTATNGVQLRTRMRVYKLKLNKKKIYIYIHTSICMHARTLSFWVRFSRFTILFLC